MTRGETENHIRNAVEAILIANGFTAGTLPERAPRSKYFATVEPDGATHEPNFGEAPVSAILNLNVKIAATRATNGNAATALTIASNRVLTFVTIAALNAATGLVGTNAVRWVDANVNYDSVAPEVAEATVVLTIRYRVSD